MSEQNASNNDEEWGDLVYSYSRAQAIADGVLVDVSEVAREAGFRWPVAMTDTVWADCVAWSKDDNAAQTYQDESGRLWDVVYMAANAVRRQSTNGRMLHYEIVRVPRNGRARQAESVMLELDVGPGDEGELVVTIMMIGES